MTPIFTGSVEAQPRALIALGLELQMLQLGSLLQYSFPQIGYSM